MIFSGLPVLFGKIFASGAGGSYITNPIPVPSQIGIGNGRASFTDGFPPLCFVPVAAGGAGPYGADYNGIYSMITAAVQWMQAGGLALYNAAFQTAIGGYPMGARVGSLSTPGLVYQNLVDNNTTNPDTGGAGWASAPGSGFTAFLTPGTSTFVIPATAVRVWVIGAGGAGGASADGSSGSIAGNVGGGGGSGGATFAYLTGQTVGSSISITVGAGGAGVSSAAGGNGGSSSFDGGLSATGGAGGPWGTNTTMAGGTTGTGFGGQIVMQGGAAGPTGPNTASYSPSALLSVIGRGGVAGLGYSAPNWFGTGGAGNKIGTGGDGASGGSGLAGGAGAPGAVLVQW